MKDKQDYRSNRRSDPFDSSAAKQLLNMGVIKDDGTANKETMNIFTIIFSGLFFVDLQEFYRCREEITEVYNLFAALHLKKNYHHMYLLFSIQYDYFKKPMPDPVWWIAGSPELIAVYMDGFIKRLGRLLNESCTLSSDEMEGDQEPNACILWKEAHKLK